MDYTYFSVQYDLQVLNAREQGCLMLAYREERINNTLLFFAKEHFKKTRKYLSQTALYKYLAFFEFLHLKKRGDMPLELNYRAMEHGPVPIEIYDHRYDKDFFQKVDFVECLTKSGNSAIIIKPKGMFEPDYFSENELQELNQLIEIFAQSWIDSTIMSDTSHKTLRSWKITYENSPNDFIDPKEEFSRDIERLSDKEITAIEERYLLQRKMRLKSC